MTTDLIGALSDARMAALLAWQRVMPYFQGDFRVFEKEGAGPATDADREADAFLTGWLGERYPEAGFLTEESDEDLSRLERDDVWIIDPIDGTTDFIAGGADFAVHVALARRDADGAWRPVATVVYEPVRGRLSSACRGGGAFVEVEEAIGGKLWWQRGVRDPSLIPFGEPQRMVVSDRSEIADLRAVASKTHTPRRLGAILEALGIDAPDRRGGLGVKAMEVGGGRVEFYLQPDGRRANEWDLCAPHLIVEEAGGRVSDMEGRAITYNREDVRLSGGVAISNGACHDVLLERASIVSAP